jgi:hypothetical protein
MEPEYTLQHDNLQLLSVLVYNSQTFLITCDLNEESVTLLQTSVN